MTLAALAILGGFVLLAWSADRFVEGAAVTARLADRREGRISWPEGLPLLLAYAAYNTWLVMTVTRVGG
jgi:Ca2+/Na+ antiporter